jgi:hypothetical protein
MDAIITSNEVAELPVAEKAIFEALYELNAQELALVGGGAANVCFL